MRRRYTGGAVKLDTKDKENSRRVPTQSHNLSFGNERILLSGMRQDELIEDEGPKIGRPRLRIDAEHEVVLDGSSSDDE